MTTRLKTIISLLLLVGAVIMALVLPKPATIGIGIMIGLLGETVFDWASTDDTDDDDSDDDGYRYA